MLIKRETGFTWNGLIISFQIMMELLNPSQNYKNVEAPF